MKTRTHLNHALFSGLFPSNKHETHAAETVAKRNDHATGSKREYIHAAYKSCTLCIHTSNPNVGPCFEWSWGFLLEGGTTQKIEAIHRFQVF